MATKAQLARWGNSLAIRIPKTVVAAAKLNPGEQLEFKIARPGAIQIRVIKPKRSLSQLVRAITPQNRHAPIDWGEPVGLELL